MSAFKTMWNYVKRCGCMYCVLTMCECVHGRGSGGASGDFTVLMTCRKNLCFSLCSSSVTAEALAWPQQLEQFVVGVVRIFHDPAGSGSTPPGVQVLQGGEVLNACHIENGFSPPVHSYIIIIIIIIIIRFVLLFTWWSAVILFTWWSVVSVNSRMCVT